MRKWIILGVLLVLTIGVAAAADIDKLKMPDGFESTGGGFYHQIDPWTNGGNGFNVIISKYTDSDFEDWTTNNTEDQYSVIKTGGLYWFTDSFMKEDGIIEVGEIDGEKYIIVFYATSNAKGGVDQAYEYMMEFNDLNNVKLIDT